MSPVANTMHGLSHWHKHVFEHLGWMVLAKAKGMHDKVTVYKHSIKCLLSSIEHVMGEYKDSDRKHDLRVMHSHVVELDRFVAKNL